jgi:shikimate kinase
MKNIILIGMPSAGKSTVGVVLAKTLGMNFVDTDLIIQENTGRLLQDIINSDGIEKFLKIEEENILNLKTRKSVVSTGGSVIYSGEAMRALKEQGTIVYLKVSYEEIVKRLDNIKTRGVVLSEGQSLEDMYLQRAPLYERYAEIVIDCEALGIEAVIGTILHKI